MVLIVIWNMDKLSDMLDSDNSYIRTSGLTLIAYTYKWDKDYKMDKIIDKDLKHITDIRPITVRQCINLLSIIAKNKPELRSKFFPHLISQIYLFMTIVATISI